MVYLVVVALAMPLWREFREPGQPMWNLFLDALLLSLVGGVFFGIRFLQRNAVEVGEARFTPRSSDRN
jgi:uncharacterized membrane-anchored protein